MGLVGLVAGDEPSTVRLSADRVASVERGLGPLTVLAQGELAPAVVGARFGAKLLAQASCRAPAPDQWFTGVGAGARHSSVLELVNPDAGPAVADVTMYGGAGQIDVPRLRGVSVPGRSSVRLELATIVPRRGELALHVLTSRGRLAASVLDSYDVLGAGPNSQEWLPPQTEPTTENLLLGLAPGPGQRMLMLTNGGDDEARATIRIVSEESVFAPEGGQEIIVPPTGVKRLKLSGPVLEAVLDGALGLAISSTSPLTATLRTVAGGDLSHTVGGAPLVEGAAAVVPEGTKRLVLAGADTVGVATVVARGVSGQRLARTRVELQPGRGTALDLPRGAVLVSVTVRGAVATASVVVTGRGAVVVPLVEQVRNGLVPAVRAGLP